MWILTVKPAVTVLVVAVLGAVVAGYVVSRLTEEK
jgi:hypothetical protein